MQSRTQLESQLETELEPQSKSESETYKDPVLPTYTWQEDFLWHAHCGLFIIESYKTIYSALVQATEQEPELFFGPDGKPLDLYEWVVSLANGARLPQGLSEEDRAVLVAMLPRGWRQASAK